MLIQADYINAQVILTFLLALTRTSAIFLSAPILSMRELPNTAKIGISAVAVLTPKHPIERSAKQENMNVLIIVFITIKTAGGNEEE